MLKEVDAFSFSGCAWLISYHLGVADVLQKELDINQYKLLGASAGALVATSLATKIPARDMMEMIESYAIQSNRYIFGPFGKMTQMVSEGLDHLLPDNAHDLVKKRVTISLTKIPEFKNHLLQLDNLESKDQLIKQLLGSCYIPLYYEKPVVENKSLILDGGFTNNVPKISAATVTISPKPSMQKAVIDIFPRKEPSVRHVLFPERKVLHELFVEGQHSGYDFLKRYKIKPIAQSLDLEKTWKA